MKRDYTEAELSMRLRHALSRESANCISGNIGGVEIADRNNVTITIDIEGVGKDPENYKELVIKNMLHELEFLGATVTSNYSMGSQEHIIKVDSLSLIGALRRSESIGEAIEKEVRERFKDFPDMLDKKDEIVHHRGDKIEIRLITKQPQNIASFVSERLGFDTVDIGIAAVAPGGAVTVSLDSVDLMEHFGIDPDMSHINDIQRKSGPNDKSR